MNAKDPHTIAISLEFQLLIERSDILCAKLRELKAHPDLADPRQFAELNNELFRIADEMEAHVKLTSRSRNVHLALADR